MPVTPPMLRGMFYTTANYVRCPDFHICRRCQMCSSYNKYSAQCQLCESVKSDHHHTCTVQQVGSLIRLEELMNRPAFSPNADPGTVTVAGPSDNLERERLIEQLQARELQKGE